MSEIKPFSGVDGRVKLAEAVPLEAPFTLNLFPSNLCNFRCSYCAQSRGGAVLAQEYQMNGEMMTLDTLDRVIEQSKGFTRPYKLVSFMGHGEPLCNPDLPEMVRRIKQADIAERVDIITNASLLTARTAQALVSAGLDVLRVSLQGISTESYRRTCGNAIPFEKMLAQLQYFYQIRGQCKLFVKTMDVTLSGEENQEFYRIFADCTDRMYIDKVKPVYSGVEYTEQERDLSEDRYGKRHEDRRVCAQPFYMLSVWPDGDVAPCDAIYRANPLGNVHTGDLVDMWRSSSLLEFWKMQLKCKRDTHPACSKCCAPNDVQHESDSLDEDRAAIMQKLEEMPQ